MFGNNYNGCVCKIKVVGVGGAGNNAVNRMIEAGVSSAEFVAINTDKQALALSKVDEENRIAIGETLTKGLGAGSNPDVGAEACEESKEKIEEVLKDVDLLFIAAGMGGGTGTGAAPVVARIARELGIVTVAVVTKPFAFEGLKRRENAAKGIAALRKYVDTIVVIPNDKLLEALPSDTSMVEALRFADENLRMGICGIADLISTPSLINLDFADVKTIIGDKGFAHMGVGQASGENRVVQAVKKAISSPILETSIEGAKGVILNVKGGTDLTLGQITEATDLINGVIDQSATVIFGANIDPTYNDKIEITVIATGFDEKNNRETPDGGRKIFSANVDNFEGKADNAFISNVKREERIDERVVRVEEFNPIEPEIISENPTIDEEPEEDDFDARISVDDQLEEEDEDEKAMKDFPSFMKKLFNKNK